MINVTKTYLPPMDEYLGYLKEIWDTGWVTNQGPIVRKLELSLSEYTQSKHFFYLNNGTIALQIAIKALGLKGEIITTPFSYVATTSSIVWEGCVPRFADIDANTLCIDLKEVEKKINKKTVGIIATHVYGNCPDLEGLEELANRYGLKIIYDAAHAFGVKYKGHSLVDYGHFTTFSFHATKLFHTIEGGAIATKYPEYAHVAEYQRRFGHNGQDDYHGLGINGKNSEFHAAMGVCLLPKINEIIRERRLISEKYDELLSELPLLKPQMNPYCDYNYAYYPVIFQSEEVLLNVKEKLNLMDVFPRRYFYPSLNTLPYLEYQEMTISESFSQRVMCLPFYPGLLDSEIEMIVGTIKKCF